MTTIANNLTALPAPVSSLVLVGTGEPRLDALVSALSRKGVLVERLSSAESVPEAVADLHPELLVAAGDAVDDAGVQVIQYVSSATDPSVPVVVISEDERLAGRIDAFLNGAIAVINWKTQVEATADDVLSIASSLSSLPRGGTSELGWVRLSELLTFVAQQVSRSANVPAHLALDRSLQLELGDGRRIAESVVGFTEQLASLIIQTELSPNEHMSDLSDLSAAMAAPNEQAEQLRGTRVLVGFSSPHQADELASALRRRGAVVAVTGAQGNELTQVGQLDPNVVLVDVTDFETDSFPLLSKLRTHPRLKWTPLLVIEREFFGDRGLNLEPLMEQILALCEDDRFLSERAVSTKNLQTAIEATGPARMLRALSSTGRSFHIEVESDELIEISLCGDLLVGADVVGGPDVTDEAPEAHHYLAAHNDPAAHDDPAIQALAALLALESGRVRIFQVEQPAHVNMLCGVEEAMARADSTLAAAQDDLAFAHFDKSTPAAGKRRRPPIVSGIRPRADTSQLAVDQPEVGDDEQELADGEQEATSAQPTYETLPLPAVGGDFDWASQAVAAPPSPSASHSHFGQVASAGGFLAASAYLGEALPLGPDGTVSLKLSTQSDGVDRLRRADRPKGAESSRLASARAGAAAVQSQPANVAAFNRASTSWSIQALEGEDVSGALAVDKGQPDAPGSPQGSSPQSSSAPPLLPSAVREVAVHPNNHEPTHRTRRPPLQEHEVTHQLSSLEETAARAERPSSKHLASQRSASQHSASQRLESKPIAGAPLFDEASSPLRRRDNWRTMGSLIFLIAIVLGGLVYTLLTFETRTVLNWSERAEGVNVP